MGMRCSSLVSTAVSKRLRGPILEQTSEVSSLSFLDDIHQAIQSIAAVANLPPTFTVGVTGRNRYVENEERIRSHASVALHEPVEDVVNMLGAKGRFVTASSAIIGAPDFSWIVGSTQSRPKLVVSASTTLCVRIVIEFHLDRIQGLVGSRSGEFAHYT
jgi:hypothetical protein